MSDKKDETTDSTETAVDGNEATVAPEHPEEGSSETEATAATEEAGPPTPPGLSVVFPLIVVTLQLGLAVYFLLTSTTPMRTYIGIGFVPLAATLLLIGWWLLARRIPLRERLAGLVLATGTVAIPLVTVQPFDVFFLVYLLPAVTSSVVIVAGATKAVPWATRRKGMLAALGLCLVTFCLLRVAGVNGNMAPLLGWRWESEGKIATIENKVAAVPKQAAPADWPGFRGKDRESRDNIDNFGIDWEHNPPKEIWRRPVGAGWSSFTVVGDYFFTQEQRGKDEAVVCYEVATGDQVWANLIEARFEERMGDGPRATPTFHKAKLYTQGATGVLQRIDAATGVTEWQRNLVEDGGGKTPTWGFCSSPLVAGDLVIVYTAAGNGKSVLAYKQTDGEIVWSGGKGTNGYSSPQLGELSLVPQVLVSSNYGIEAFDPKTGTPLWDQEWNIKSNPRVAQPFVMDLYHVIGGTGQGKGARLIKAINDVATGTWTVETRWESDRFRPYFNDFVYYQGYCYGYDGNRLACMDTTDGKVRWTGDREGGQILLLFDMEMLLVLTEGGEVLLIPAFPEEGRIVARMKALEGKTWNHPVVAHGKLFVRNDTEAVCYELPPAPVEEAPAPAAH